METPCAVIWSFQHLAISYQQLGARNIVHAQYYCMYMGLEVMPKNQFFGVLAVLGYCTWNCMIIVGTYMFSYHTVILYTRNPSPSATTSEASGGKLASLAGPPRSAHQHPHARFARHYPPRRSLRSPTAPHARFARPHHPLEVGSKTAASNRLRRA